MAQWAGVSEIPDNSMRGAFSAKKVAIMERFYNDKYVCQVGGKTTTDVPPAAVPSLKPSVYEVEKSLFC